jgi:DNA-directed RNA polymerase subunit K/omega
MTNTTASSPCIPNRNTWLLLKKSKKKYKKYYNNMIDYKKTKAPQTTITRDMNELTEKVGNVYETIAIIGKRSNQISTSMKKELDAKLQDFSIPQDSADETFENQEQIEISKNYERLPKATLIATQELIDDKLIYRGSNRDDVLK